MAFSVGVPVTSPASELRESHQLMWTEESEVQRVLVVPVSHGNRDHQEQRQSSSRGGSATTAKS